jgi:hypothetical protein
VSVSPLPPADCGSLAGVGIDQASVSEAIRRHAQRGGMPADEILDRPPSTSRFVASAHDLSNRQERH